MMSVFYNTDQCIKLELVQVLDMLKSAFGNLGKMSDQTYISIPNEHNYCKDSEKLVHIIKLTNALKIQGRCVQQTSAETKPNVLNH